MGLGMIKGFPLPKPNSCHLVNGNFIGDYFLTIMKYCPSYDNAMDSMPSILCNLPYVLVSSGIKHLVIYKATSNPTLVGHLELGLALASTYL
jgi:hypothetical protein